MTDQKITQNPDGYVSFNLTVPWKKLQTEYQKHLLEHAKSVEIKGFRKGKAPLDLVERELDKGKLYAHVLEEVFPEIYLAHLKKHNLLPLIDPRLTTIKSQNGSDWEFKVEIAVRPQVKLGAYQTKIKSALKKHKLRPPKSKSSAKSPSTTNKTEEPKEDPRLKILFDTLLETAELTVAEILVEEETKSALSRLIRQLEPLKISLTDYAKSISKTQEELIKEYKTTALTNLKLEFVIDEIIKELKPSVTEEEVSALKPQPDQKSYARYVLEKRKVIDKLLEL